MGDPGGRGHDGAVPEPAGRKRNVAADVVSVVALLVGFGVTAVILVVMLFVLACGFSGACTYEDDTPFWGLLVAAGVVFLGVPALVAAVRRDARWLLAPVVEAAAIVLFLAANGIGRG